MAVECRSACSKAVFLKWNGGQPDLDNLGNCQGNAGSQNWPWGWALVHEDWGRLEQLLDEELATGLRTAEFGSEKYDPDVLAYRVAALARIPASHPVRRKLVQSLRAYLAFLALTAVPGPRTRTRLRRPEARIAPDSVDHAYFESDGDSRWYAGGVSVATPGHRWHPDSVAQSLLGPQLAWALGYAVTYRRKIQPCKPDPTFEDDYTWPLALCELAMGAKFGQPTPAAAWGLAAGDRERLRAVIDGNSAAGLAEVVAMIAPYPLFGPLFVEVVGTTLGRMARLEHSVNSFKPQIACCKIDFAGSYEAVVPSSWSKGNAERATTEDRGTFIAAFAGEGEIDMAKIGGDRIFRFSWDARGPRALGATDLDEKTTPPVVTTTTPPPVTTTTAPPITTTPAPVSTTTPVPQTTTPPPPPVTTTPAPVTTTTPAPVVTSTPPPVVTSTPPPVVTSTPPPVTTTPAPIVTTTPAPVTTTTLPPPKPQPTPEELAEIANGIESLQLAWKQKSFQRHLAAELRGLPAPVRPLSEIADDVATFGINPDQEQGPRWLALVARLRELAPAQG